MSNEHGDPRQYAQAEAAQYGAFFRADTTDLEEDLVEGALEEADPDYEDAGLLEDEVRERVQDRFCAVTEEYEELFEDVDPYTVWDEDASSVHKEDVLAGVMEAGVEYLQDEEDVDIGPAEGVELWFGPRPGTYDWGRDIVRVGEQRPSIEYEPEMLGLMVHELYHRKQFQDKVADGVEEYNDLASDTAALGQVEEGTPEYRDTGVLMQERGDQVRELIEEAAGQDGADRYLAAAVDEEREQHAPDETDPFAPTDVDGGDSTLFGWEDEVVPHIMYLRAEGLEDDPTAVEEYIGDVVEKNTGGEKIAAKMRERL